MPVKIVFFCKGTTTFRAFELLLATVYFKMLVKVAFSSKGSTTFRAFEGLFTTVQTEMFFQPRIFLENLITHWALVDDRI